MLDSQLAQANAMIEKQSEGQGDETRVKAKPPGPTKPGQLKHSPRIENLAAFTDPPPVINHGYTVRPPWTPPPSPSPHGKESTRQTHAVGLAAEGSICDGRSSNSLKTNFSLRNQLLSSVPSSNALHKLAQSGSSNGDIPYLDENEYDVGLTLRFDERSFETACGTPLNAPNLEEDTYFDDHKSPMMKHEEEEGKFMPEPLEVEDGVAVLEESVELGVPDVVTQA